MRRNRGYNNPQQSSDGPLLTTHLRDLDIELELLKRKRDIIQKEQDMLNRLESKRQYDYGQSSISYDREEPNNYQFSTNNYSSRYDSPSRSGHYTRSQAPKRQTPNQYWSSSTSNKNFTTTSRINPWQTSAPKQNTGYSAPKKFQPQPSQPRNISTTIRPLMSIQPSISQKIQKKYPPRKDFRPSKVSKPKPQPVPNKLTTYSSDVAKKLVSKVFDTDVNKKAEFSQILRADKSPTVQMKGRLELALGTIMKDIKSEHCTSPGDLEYFNASFIQRLIKHTIRTRIRNVMLDQVVGNVNDIVENYRKKYPKNTDIELVQLAKDAQGLSTKTIGLTQLIESDDPEDFYRKNMAKALTTKLEEMFQTLEKLYMKENNLEELAKNMPEPKNIGNGQDKTEDEGTNNDDKQKDNTDKEKDNTDKEKDNTEKQKENTDKQNDNTDKQKDNTETVKDDDVLAEPVCEKFSKIKYYKNFMDELIEARLPKILPKFKDMLLSIMLMDRDFLGKKALIVSQFKKKTSNYLAPNEQSVGEANQEQLAEASDTSDTKEPTTAVESTPIISSETTTEPKKEASSTTTPKKSEPAVVSTSKSSPVPRNAPMGQNEVSKTPVSEELYYVKLISRPALPARAVIYDFLNQFKPTSIKKHKSISNLLVIGFKNIEDYNKILTVNESVVGNATIVIKASEQQMSKPKQSTPSQNDSNEKVLITPNLSLIDSSLNDTDLNNQINDLLTSIRQADESNDNKISSDNTPKTDVDSVKTEPNNDKDKTDQELNSESTTDNNEKSKQEAGENVDATDKSDDHNTNVDSNNDSSKEKDVNKKELETITEDSETDKNSKTDDRLKDNLMESGRATPTRSSSRLANVTPCTIRTRRASRLAQNN